MTAATRQKRHRISPVASLAIALSVTLTACATKPVAPPAPAAPVAKPAVPATPPPAPAPKPSSTSATLDQYRAWIGEARIKHPYPETTDRMYAVMMCESGGKASIINPAGPYKGLFQYSPLTWGGPWNTYKADGILDAKAQIFATALAWSRNMQKQWGCYKKTT